MKGFKFYAPTQVVFGEHSEEQVADLVKKYGGHKVLVHYGGRITVGSFKVLAREDMEAIYKLAR